MQDSTQQSDDIVWVEDTAQFQEVVAEDGPFLVDFFAEWCGPCQMLEPTLDVISRETHATVVKVDIDQHRELALDHGVRGVPTLILYEAGEPADRVVGLQTEGQLREFVDG